MPPRPKELSPLPCVFRHSRRPNTICVLRGYHFGNNGLGRVIPCVHLRQYVRPDTKHIRLGQPLPGPRPGCAFRTHPDQRRVNNRFCRGRGGHRSLELLGAVPVFCLFFASGPPTRAPAAPSSSIQRVGFTVDAVGAMMS